jgi:hypothetical protein
MMDVKQAILSQSSQLSPAPFTFYQFASAPLMPLKHKVVTYSAPLCLMLMHQKNMPLPFAAVHHDYSNCYIFRIKPAAQVAKPRAAGPEI